MPGQVCSVVGSPLTERRWGDFIYIAELGKSPANSCLGVNLHMWCVVTALWRVTRSERISAGQERAGGHPKMARAEAPTGATPVRRGEGLAGDGVDRQ